MFLLKRMCARLWVWVCLCSATCVLATYAHLAHSEPAEKSNPQSEQPLSTLLANLEPLQQGQFEQKRLLSALTEPLVSLGQFQFSQNEKLVWEITSPFAITYSYDGSTLEQTEFGETIQINMKDDPTLVGFFSFFFEILNGDTQSLEKLFDHRVINQEETNNINASDIEANTLILQLLPKKRFLKKSFESIQINVTETKIHQVEIIENSKNKVILAFVE